MSKRKSGLNIHGLLLLDKRLGVSSNKALQEVRRLFNANKAGHTGSLDPLATGLLPLCFGEATKVSALMLDDDKRYQVTVQLGVITDSGDAEGIVLETRSVPEFTVDQITNCLRQFTGSIAQVPPMYSALKLNGKKLYELARQGICVERKARQILIKELKLLNFSRDQLELEVFCSKGTYIRSLAEDMGEFLGCGATVTALRRLQSGQFQLSEAYTLEQLSSMTETELQQCLLAVDAPLSGLIRLELSDTQALLVKQGQQVTVLDNVHSTIDKDSNTVRLYHDGAFLGLGEMLLNDKLAPKRLFNMDNLERCA